MENFYVPFTFFVFIPVHLWFLLRESRSKIFVNLTSPKPEVILGILEKAYQCLTCS